MTDAWIYYVAAGSNAAAAVANIAAACMQTSRFAQSSHLVAAVLFAVSAAIWVYVAKG